MSGPRVAAPAGGPSLPFCERCGNLIGPAAHLLHIGLSMCPSCGVYACDRCWTRAGGGCPGCGISARAARYLAAAAAVSSAPAVGAAVPVRAAPPGSTTAAPGDAAVGAAAPVNAPAAVDVVATSVGASHGRPRAWRAPIAIAGVATVVLAASVLAFTLGGPFRPAGELGLALGTPGAVTTSNPGNGQSPTSSFSAVLVPTSSGVVPSAAPSVTPPQIPAATPTLPSGTVGPAPTPGPTPVPTAKPAPTPRPTPAPTPRPTRSPTPRPTPCELKAPQLVGQHRYDAAGIWSGAGFTGAVVALHGDGNYLIASQDLLAGQMYPCDASVTVGPASSVPN